MSTPQPRDDRTDLHAHGRRQDGAAPGPGNGLVTADRLGPAEAEAVRRLARRAADADRVAPLSEQFLLDLDAPAGAVTHVLGYAGGADPVGYAQVRDHAVELVVDPGHRRRGMGRDLVLTLLRQDPAVQVWAHGDLVAARALASGVGLRVVRELHRMSRPLTAGDDQDVRLPAGFAARPFRPGADDEAWVATNAAAFADHPEQGSIDLRGLSDRMRQPWFDPDGLILVEDEDRGPDDPDIAAFHWTKVDPEERTADGEPAGEVYVLGVHPAYQGRGLAGPLTRLGLAHLARRGLHAVVLYVDGDNEPALRTYRRTGFRVEGTDVMYARHRRG